ncbi:ABC transporter permease [Methanococcus aeolicus]|uniref:ABC-2 type transport system permease protein n=1 Tax=Methanococcus aeolicus (strain ATCC BAA-1280 / DSM 17508 / OCM 812 / Nankai-3) TaxID=419665 RepID=A6UX06_META3|nr:ABC transporter permease [Methanococcus aeolicus]ABR57028.1 putative ABC-2 type transport system permease protein [Methanococcus aeolicus Nankai-3]UXM85025.1 ABC transporter permease [Methanococcus aeolicus]
MDKDNIKKIYKNQRFLNSLTKIKAIAKREILSNIKRKQFILMILLVPVVMILITMATAYFTAEVEDQKIGYIDNFGMDIPPLFKSFNPLKQENITMQFIKYNNTEIGKNAVINGDINAFIIIPKNYLENEPMTIYSKSKTIPSIIRSSIKDIVLSTVLKDKVDEKTYNIVKSPINLEIYSISKKGEEKENIISQMMPFGFAMLLYIAIISVSGLCTNSVIEEKQHRIMELLLTTTNSTNILIGKIIGISFLGLIQMSIWILFALPIISMVALKIPPFLMVSAVVFFVMAYLFYVSLLSGLSSLFTTQKDAGQIISPIIMVQIIPLLILTLIQSNPNHYIIKILSFVPFTAPQVMLMRMSITHIEPLEVYLSMGVMFIFTVLSFISAVKLFKIGSMIYDEEMTIKKVIKIIK